MSKCIPTMVEGFLWIQISKRKPEFLDHCVNFDAQCMTVDTHSLVHVVKLILISLLGFSQYISIHTILTSFYLLFPEQNNFCMFISNSKCILIRSMYLIHF